MIRGYLKGAAEGYRPFVNAVVTFGPDGQDFEIPMLVDTGADHTVISPGDALLISLVSGIDLSSLEQGSSNVGVGGTAATRVADAVVRLDTFSTSMSITILEPPQTGRVPAIPSLLGRDIISQFGLFFDHQTRRVLLLDRAEVDALNLP